jgi:hypothetical protein
VTRPTFRLPLPAILLLAPALLVVNPVSPAYASCAPSRSPATQAANWHDGVLKDVSIPVNGSGVPQQDASVLADIYQYDSYVYPNAETTAWVMLQKYASSSCCWAQVGWYKYKYSDGTTERGTFTSWTHDLTFSENDWPGDVSSGQTTRYQVYFQGQSFGNWLFYRNGSLIDAEGPEFVPTSAYISGEISNLANQMPGGSNDGSHEVFSNMGYMQPAGTWGSYGGYADGHNTTYFGETNAGSTNWDAIWDKACSN